MMLALAGDTLYIGITELNVENLRKGTPLEIDFGKAERLGALSRRPERIRIVLKPTMLELIEVMEPFLPPGSGHKAREQLDPVTGEIRREVTPLVVKRLPGKPS